MDAGARVLGGPPTSGPQRLLRAGSRHPADRHGAGHVVHQHRVVGQRARDGGLTDDAAQQEAGDEKQHDPALRERHVGKPPLRLSRPRWAQQA